MTYDSEVRAAYMYVVPHEDWPAGSLYNEILNTPSDAPTVVLDLKGDVVVGIEFLECTEPKPEGIT